MKLYKIILQNDAMVLTQAQIKYNIYKTKRNFPLLSRATFDWRYSGLKRRADVIPTKSVETVARLKIEGVTWRFVNTMCRPEEPTLSVLISY